MLLLLASFLSGLALAAWRAPSPAGRRLASRLVLAGLAVLLALMGARIGSSPEVLGNVGTLGAKAAVLAAGTIAGSLLFVWVFAVAGGAGPRARRGTGGRGDPAGEGTSGGDPANDGARRDERGPAAAAGTQDPAWRMLVLVLASLGTGIALGATVLPAAWVSYLDDGATTALALLLFAIGIEVGSDRAVWSRLWAIGPRALAIPALVGVGSVLGGWAAGLLVGLPDRHGAAVGGGFGWYTLSGVLLTRLSGPELGTLAFLSNVSRELMSFLLIPILARRAGFLAALAPGGATTMDTTLPLIARVTDAETSVLAVVNGTILSALAPVVIGAVMGA